MSEAITRYAIETESHRGRSFVLTGFELNNGKRYDGIFFFGSQAAATKSMLEDAQEGDNDWITEVLVHSDGLITDAKTGQPLIEGLALQTSFPEAELQEMLADYYQDEFAALDPPLPSAPGF